MPWCLAGWGVNHGTMFTLLLVLLLGHVVLSIRNDTSITTYKVVGKTCLMYSQPCKKTYRRYFECKCPSLRPACLGPGRYYDARCVPEEWASYGRKWMQPDFPPD